MAVIHTLNISHRVAVFYSRAGARTITTPLHSFFYQVCTAKQAILQLYDRIASHLHTESQRSSLSHHELTYEDDEAVKDNRKKIKQIYCYVIGIMPPCLACPSAPPLKEIAILTRMLLNRMPKLAPYLKQKNIKEAKLQ